jgi:prephenate dehydrogenase
MQWGEQFECGVVSAECRVKYSINKPQVAFRIRKISRKTDMSFLFNRMAIAGLGLIGGSLARIAKEKKIVESIIGLGRRTKNLELALSAGCIDEYSLDLRKGLDDVEIMVIATPVGVIADLVREISNSLKPGTIITDVGSVKKGIVQEVESFLPKHLHFVGAHPIAGTENSGFKASSAQLFQGARCIITPTPNTNASALDKVKNLWKKVGCEVVLMEAEKHDRIFAAVSHLPHLIAYCLVNTVINVDKKEDGVVKFSAGGLRDFTRIAASDPSMWRDIFLMNKKNLLPLIDHFQKVVEGLRSHIGKEDAEKLTSELDRARSIRRKIT